MAALPRDASPRAVRRLDYQPPALVDALDLTFALEPASTRVTATLAFSRNPAAPGADRAAPVVLDGEEQRAHPGFNERNANRVRALVGAFALRNWSAFHGADGSGYAFVAEQTVALDRANPHIASLLAGAFNRSTYGTGSRRRGVMRSVRRCNGSLRRRTFRWTGGEVVTKALAA